MGAEATCRVSVDGKRATAKVLLETDEVIVRGDLRCRVPFASITAIDVDGGRLTLRSSAAGPVVLELGAPAAAKWADKIRSPKTVTQKLGLKPDSVVSAIGLADPTFLDGVAATKGRLKAGSTVVFLGVERLSDLDRIRTLAPKIEPGVALWVVHPKGKDGVADTAIFGIAREVGLSYTKVVRISETHTAERLNRSGTKKSAAR